MDIRQFVRPNIRDLKPYSSARSEFKGDADVFLDANENPFDTGVNRYPDPLQRTLKQKISEIKGIDSQHIFLGNGSDEVIDLLIRIFCEPGQDKIMILPPTYGMYKVSADIANVGIVTVPLQDGFQPDVEGILESANEQTKLLFICHPNNPTGNAMESARIEKLVQNFRGIVVVDEAYIDFVAKKSTTGLLKDFRNLVVMQTFSKAWGLAGIRLGMAFAGKAVIDLFNKVKPPYNINQLTQEAALKALNRSADKEVRVGIILEQRQVLQKQLTQYSFVQEVFASDTNFLLVRVSDPDDLYRFLANRKIIVRNRSNVTKCEGCLRITIGTPEENNHLLVSLKQYPGGN